MAKVTIDLDRCVACGMCVDICPELFEPDMSTLKVKLIGGVKDGDKWNLDVTDPSGAEKAAAGCLMKAITVE